MFCANVEIKNFQRPEIDVDAQNSNLAAANAKLTLNGVKNINGFTAVYSDRTDRAFQLQYDSGEIASIAITTPVSGMIFMTVKTGNRFRSFISRHNNHFVLKAYRFVRFGT